MKTEIKQLAKQAEDASNDLKAAISELHLRILGGLPSDQLAQAEALLKRLQAALGKKIKEETERMGRGPDTRALPA
jgi:HPt (histidine-containing phosphotransfer) domain-containing protein